MPISSNNGYIGIVKQTAKGVATSPTIPIPFLEEAQTIGIEAEVMRDDKDIVSSGIMMKRTESLGFSCYARPNISAYLLAYFLGADAKTGAGDPYTHVLTRLDQGRAWITIDRILNKNVATRQRLYDYKISKIKISGESGNPIKFEVEGEALNLLIISSSVFSSAYETSKPFMFYDGTGRFSYAGSVIDTIDSFSIELSIDSLGGLQDDEYQIIDLPDFEYNVSVELSFKPDTFTNWKNIAYGGGSTRSETIYTAALDFDFQYTEGAAARQLKIAIPSVMYQSISGNAITAGDGTLVESIAGVAKKLPTTEMVTCTVKNSLSDDLI